MAEKRVMVAIPESTDKVVTELSAKLDEPKGKVVKIAVAEFAKKVCK